MIYLVNVLIALAITGAVFAYATVKVYRRKVRIRRREEPIAVPLIVNKAFITIPTQDVDCPYCGDHYLIPIYLMEERSEGTIIIPCRTCGGDFMIGRQGEGLAYKRWGRLLR